MVPKSRVIEISKKIIYYSAELEIIYYSAELEIIYYSAELEMKLSK